MTMNLQNTANFTSPFIQYSPLFAGLGGEPAVSIASMIRNSILNPPITWYFNRAQTTFSTQAGLQDYVQPVPDLAFVEKVSLTDDQGVITELKDIYNNMALSVSAKQQRPSAMSVEMSSIISGALSFRFRFLGVPEKIYLVTIVYQKMAPQFGPFFISNAANAVGPNTTYNGTFDINSFPVGASAVITGFKTNVVNNGTFLVVSVTPSTLTVVNAAGVAEVIQAYVSNYSWDPIPDQYSDIYNNLFLSEAMAMVDDPRAAQYRQRGVAAFLSKASGLSEMQKSTFIQQWTARDVERAATLGAQQLGHAGRGV